VSPPIISGMEKYVYVHIILLNKPVGSDYLQERERDKFNVYGSVHRNNILVYKSQQDAHVTEFILSDNCFGRCYHPS
jgi:hypothetical protein